MQIRGWGRGVANQTIWGERTRNMEDKGRGIQTWKHKQRKMDMTQRQTDKSKGITGLKYTGAN